MKFKFEDIVKDGTKVIHCDTVDKAIILLNTAHDMGFRWINKEQYSNNYKYLIYTRDTCYNIKEGTISSFVEYKRVGCTIVEFEDIEFKNGENKMENLTKLNEELRVAQENLKKIEDKILFEKQRKERETPEQYLARIVHDLMCTWNHTDGCCSWHHWEGKTDCWETDYSHKKYLKKVKALRDKGLTIEQIEDFLRNYKLFKDTN